jgi:hypothetical protein
MNKNAVVIIRLPESLKRNLEDHARAQRRSLSAQVLHELELAANDPVRPNGPAKFLGRYKGSWLPTGRELRQVRSLLWGHLDQ